MALILHIDTSIDVASICLSQNEDIILTAQNENMKDHAAWLQAAIADMMETSGFSITKLEAVAVTNGPGSYTGLRVGLSTAKGICYALKIPLITMGTLEVMAFKAKDFETDLLCPMIDARRMEVFTAIYDKNLLEIEKPHARILDKNSFENILSYKRVLFFGNGMEKFKSITNSNNLLFENIRIVASDMVIIANQCFTKSEFANLAYAEPFYIKDFFNPSSGNTTKL